MIELWNINKVLRWTGFRVVIAVPIMSHDTEARADPDENAAGTSTKIGVEWVGLYGSKGWRKWEPHTPPLGKATEAFLNGFSEGIASGVAATWKELVTTATHASVEPSATPATAPAPATAKPRAKPAKARRNESDTSY